MSRQKQVCDLEVDIAWLKAEIVRIQDKKYTWNNMHKVKPDYFLPCVVNLTDGGYKVVISSNTFDGTTVWIDINDYMSGSSGGAIYDEDDVAYWIQLPDQMPEVTE